MGEKRKSRLAKAMDKRERKIHGPFPLPSGYVTHADVDTAAVLVRVLVKDEEDKALVAAHKLRNELVDEGAESALSDADLLTDNKAIFALYKSMRDADDSMFPAFFDQHWMRSKLTTDKIQHLLNVYFACREAEEVMRWTLEVDVLEERLDAIADADPESALPEVLLADCADAWLRQAVIQCALRLRAERRALYRTRQLLSMAASLVAQVEVTEANAAALEAWGTATSSELSAEEPWGTRAVVEQGWVGLTKVDYQEARELLKRVCSMAADMLPDDDLAEDDDEAPGEISGDEPPKGAIIVGDDDED